MSLHMSSYGILDVPRFTRVLNSHLRDSHEIPGLPNDSSQRPSGQACHLALPLPALKTSETCISSLENVSADRLRRHKDRNSSATRDVVAPVHICTFLDPFPSKFLLMTFWPVYLPL